MKKDFNEYDEIHLTDGACDWIEQNATLIVTNDLFMQYVCAIDKRHAFLTTIDGLWLFLDMKKHRLLSEKEIYKYIKKLVRIGFMEWRVEPFPETVRDQHLNYNIDNAIYLDISSKELGYDSQSENI